MQFDGYRIPHSGSSMKVDGIDQEFTWYAVLVWCGRKPSPKYCATKDDLTSSPYFQNHSLAKEEPTKNLADLGKGGCMQVGKVNILF